MNVCDVGQYYRLLQLESAPAGLVRPGGPAVVSRLPCSSRRLRGLLSCSNYVLSRRHLHPTVHRSWRTTRRGACWQPLLASSLRRSTCGRSCSAWNRCLLRIEGRVCWDDQNAALQCLSNGSSSHHAINDLPRGSRSLAASLCWTDQFSKIATASGGIRAARCLPLPASYFAEQLFHFIGVISHAKVLRSRRPRPSTW